MKKQLLIIAILLAFGSIFALTGYGISNTFHITAQTLPMELSSFSVTATAQHHAQVSWITQSESNLLGFYVYRSSTSMLKEASIISPQIPANNSSTLHRYTFTDLHIPHSGTYYYWLQALEMDGEIIYHGPVYVTIRLDENQEAPPLPQITCIKSIFPNPFNPSTTILYQLANPAKVTIEIYNLRGQAISSFSATHSQAGIFKYGFDGVDSSGNTLPSGIYNVRMNANGKISSQKIVLMK